MRYSCLILWALLAIVQPAHAQNNSRLTIKQQVLTASQNSPVPTSLALAVAKVASDFNAHALSSGGARGVMQLMPATAQQRFQTSPEDLWDSTTNIRLGLRFLADLYQTYGTWDRALSHYQGGPLVDNRLHPFTRTYIRKVQQWQKIYQDQLILWRTLELNHP